MLSSGIAGLAQMVLFSLLSGITAAAASKYFVPKPPALQIAAFPLKRAHVEAQHHRALLGIGECNRVSQWLQEWPQDQHIQHPQKDEYDFPCPFWFMKYNFQTSVEDDWVSHTLLHFGDHGPPRRTKCPCRDCSMEFYYETHGHAWELRMRHVADHYYRHKPQTFQHDYGLYKYLWQKRLISDDLYGELCSTGLVSHKLITGGVETQRRAPGFGCRSSTQTIRIMDKFFEGENSNSDNVLYPGENISDSRNGGSGGSGDSNKDPTNGDSISPGHDEKQCEYQDGDKRSDEHNERARQTQAESKPIPHYPSKLEFIKTRAIDDLVWESNRNCTLRLDDNESGDGDSGYHSDREISADFKLSFRKVKTIHDTILTYESDPQLRAIAGKLNAQEVKGIVYAPGPQSMARHYYF